MSDELEQSNESVEQKVDALAEKSASSSNIPSAFATGEVSLAEIIEAALMAAGEPLSIEQICALFDPNERPQNRDVRQCLQAMAATREGTALELKEVASGWRFQVREAYAPWVKRLFTEKPQRYSRALLETLAIIAYRQPVTRGEIEEIRGVAVSTNIMRTLQERDWIRVLGHKELPGRPAMYGTNKGFLDYFNLKSLDELPSLAELKELDKINIDLDLSNPDHHADPDESEVPADVADDSTDEEVTVQLPLADTEAEAVDAAVADVDGVNPDDMGDVAEQDEDGNNLIVTDGSNRIH